MDFDAAAFIAGRNMDSVFADARLDDLSPAERTLVWRCFESEVSPRVRLESEKGVDGCWLAGSAVVWNAHEFAPWTFRAATSVIAGNLHFDEPNRRDAVVEIHAPARVFVGSLTAGVLRVLGGELHVIGAIDVLEMIVREGAHASGGD